MNMLSKAISCEIPLLLVRTTGRPDDRAGEEGKEDVKDHITATTVLPSSNPEDRRTRTREGFPPLVLFGPPRDFYLPSVLPSFVSVKVGHASGSKSLTDRVATHAPWTVYTSV